MNQFVRVAIALGSNLGDRLSTLRQAALRMKEEFLENAVGSQVYETPPWGITEQPYFLNAVMVGDTEWKPPALLNYLKSLERELGRSEGVRNGPRVLDLDIIAYGSTTLVTEALEIPHPRLTDREFVLRPLCDVWPDWIHPATGQRAEQMLARLLETRPAAAKAVAPLL